MTLATLFMSLIQDQQRDNSGVETPEVKPIKVFSPPGSASNVSFPPTTPPNISEPQPTIDPAQAIPQENSLQGWDNKGGKWQPESEFPDAMVEKPAVVGFTGRDKLPEQLNLPGMPATAPKFTPAPLPSLFTDTRQQGLGVNFSQPILGNSLPTIYAPPPEIGLGGQIGNQLFTRANTLAAQQQAQQLAQANKQAQWAQEALGKLPNVPSVDKPWHGYVTGFLSDVFLGTPEAQKKADQGQWNLDPTKGSLTFGRQGAGIGGFLKYGLNLGGNIVFGAAAEVNKGVAGGLQAVGVDKKTAEGFTRSGFLTFLPDKIGAIEFSRLKPENILGFNFDTAKKQGNLVIRAISGDDVGDINDPKESTGTTGRVFYSPRRQLTDKRDAQGRRLYQAWYEDPLGAALQIGSWFVNPGDIPVESVINAGISKVFGRGASKVPELTNLPEQTYTNVPRLGASGINQQIDDLAKRGEAARAAIEEREYLRNRVLITPVAPGDIPYRTPDGAIIATGTERPKPPALPPANDAPIPPESALTIPEKPGALVNETNTNIYAQAPGFEDFGRQLETTELRRVLITAPPAATPTKVIQIEPGGQITQRSLPPAINPYLVPPTNSKLILPVSSPAHTALEIGVGTPRIAPILEAGELTIRSYPEMIEAISKSEPKLLDNYEGSTWAELKDHLSNTGDAFGNLDFSQFNAIGKTLSIDISNTQPIQKRLSLTSERIQKLRQIRARVDERSSLSLDDLDKASADLNKTKEQLANTLEIRQNYADELYGFKQKTLDSLTQLEQNISELKKANAPDSVLEKYINSLQQTLDDYENLIADKTKALEDLDNAIKSLDGNDLYVNTLRYERALENLKEAQRKNKIDLGGFKIKEDVVTNVNLFPPPTALTKDDLITAAEELAAQKLTIEAPLQQLSEFFDETVDFGRRTLQRTDVKPTTADEILSVLENGGKPNLHPSVDSLSITQEITTKPRTTKKPKDESWRDVELPAKFQDEYAQLENTYYKKSVTLEGVWERISSNPKAIIIRPLSDPVYERLVKKAYQIDPKWVKDLDFNDIYSRVKTLQGLEEAIKRNPQLTKKLQALGELGGKQEVTKVETLRFGSALRSGDFNELQRLAQKTGKPVSELIQQAVDLNNSVLSAPQVVNRAITPQYTTKIPTADLYHGTAISNWTPSYNLSLSGSRGELGSGLYLTKDAEVATQYAKARMGENANPATLDLNIDEPGVYKVSGGLTSTLDARASIPSTSDFFKELYTALPAELVPVVKKTLAKKKSQTYSSFLTTVENSMVKAGIDPTEDTLQAIQEGISSKLRDLGYDSVYDAKSGFALALDNSTLKVTEKTALPVPDFTEATLARYNADAYSSKFFPERPTTDANLRDSSYKLLEQLRQNVDDKLAEVQDKLIQRLGAEETESILSKLDEVPGKPQRPQSVQEIFDEIETLANDLCGA